MDKLLNSLRAVLWASIGLGGRRADAGRRIEGASMPLILLVSLLLVLLLVAGLVTLARIAAG